MKADLGTALGENATLVRARLIGRHASELIRIERRALPRGGVDPNSSGGLVEPRVADRHEEPVPTPAALRHAGDRQICRPLVVTIEHDPVQPSDSPVR